MKLEPCKDSFVFNPTKDMCITYIELASGIILNLTNPYSVKKGISYEVRLLYGDRVEIVENLIS